MARCTVVRALVFLYSRQDQIATVVVLGDMVAVESQGRGFEALRIDRVHQSTFANQRVNHCVEVQVR